MTTFDVNIDIGTLRGREKPTGRNRITAGVEAESCGSTPSKGKTFTFTTMTKVATSRARTAMGTMTSTSTSKGEPLLKVIASIWK